MALSALNVLSGIAAAAAGLSGEKVSKTGSIPGFDLAAIVPALLGNKTGGATGLVGTLATAAAKSGKLNASNLATLAKLAGSLISSTKKTQTAAKGTAAEGIMGLASLIFSNSGSGTDLGSIAKLATQLGKTAEGEKGLTSIASELGSTLKNSFGVHFDGAGTALNAMTKVMGGDAKADLIKTVLKGIS
jgi:hypothetical protein